MARQRPVESRDGVDLTNLDQELFDGSGATKRDLVDYLDAISDRLLPELADRPLSVVRMRPGQPAFMQKNLPSYAPEWIGRVSVWAQASHRTVDYALCDSRRTLLWFANQRAVEYHPTLLLGQQATVTHLVLDLDPPEGVQGWSATGVVVRTARLVQRALSDSGLAGACKTSGAKGLLIAVPVVASTTVEDAAAATRALAARAAALDPSVATTAYIVADRAGKVFVDSTRSGGATLVAAYSPRVRPGVPVSFPVAWDDLDDIHPQDFTITTAVDRLAGTDRWRAQLPAPQELPADVLREGHQIPVARVAAMHEGKRRKRARQAPQ